MKLGSPLPGKNVLFVVNEAGEFVELRRVALAAKMAGYDVSFLFVQAGYINLKPDRAFLPHERLRCLLPGASVETLSIVDEVRKDREGA